MFFYIPNLPALNLSELSLSASSGLQPRFKGPIIKYVQANWHNEPSAPLFAVRQIAAEINRIRVSCIPAISIENFEGNVVIAVIRTLLADPSFLVEVVKILSTKTPILQQIAATYFPGLINFSNYSTETNVRKEDLDKLLQEILQQWSYHIRAFYGSRPCHIIINYGLNQTNDLEEILAPITIDNVYFILVYSENVPGKNCIELQINIDEPRLRQHPNLLMAQTFHPQCEVETALLTNLRKIAPVKSDDSTEPYTYQEEVVVLNLDWQESRADEISLYQELITHAALLGSSFDERLLENIFLQVYQNFNQDQFKVALKALKDHGVLIGNDGFYTFVTPQYQEFLFISVEFERRKVFFEQFYRTMIQPQVSEFFSYYEQHHTWPISSLIIPILYTWDQNIAQIQGDIFKLIELHYIIGQRVMLTTGESNLERAKLLLEQELTDPYKRTQERVELLIKIYKKYIQIRLLKDKNLQVSELYESLKQQLEQYLVSLPLEAQTKIRADFLIGRAFQGFFSLQMMDIFACANALFSAAGLLLSIEASEEVHMKAGWEVYNDLVRSGVFTQDGLNFYLLKQLASISTSEQGVMQENIIEMLVLLALMNYFMGKHGSAFHYSMLAMRNCLSGSKLSTIVIILFLLNVKFHLDCVPTENVVETTAEFHPKNIFFKMRVGDLEELLRICADTNNAYTNLTRGLATICFNCLYQPYRRVISQLQEDAHHCSNIGDLTAAALNAGNALCMQTSQTIPSPEQVLAVSEQTDALQTAHDLIAVFGITGMTLLDGNADSFERSYQYC